MVKNRFELHEERLATTDEKGHRVYLHPEDIKGKWRDRRSLLFKFLIGLYLILPWINFQGKQIILLDIPHREFTFFGQTFFAHDAPLFLLIVLFFLFSMGFITSIWGRVWCGWACPQTVFIDAVYGRIERWVEGKARQRQRLDEAPWNLEKIWKKSLKWFLFVIVSLHISHSFLGYFVGARNLFWITLSPPQEHMTLFIIMLSITALTLFDFGWFKEQFCIIACPYGRLQSVMMDEDSLVVAYDSNRGEPRRGTTERSNEGDCINCYHCVKACPTGIDIRRGSQQLECIACTNCIDACDEIMVKVGKEVGLIRYDTESALEGKKTKIFKARSFVYLGVITLVTGIFIYNLAQANNLKVTLIRGTKVPYRERVLRDGTKEVTNLYRLRLDYKSKQHKDILFRLKNKSSREAVELITPQNPFPLDGGRSQNVIMHFKFKPQFLSNGSQTVHLQFIDTKKNLILEKEVRLVGPLN